MKQVKRTYTVDELVQMLKNESENATIEGQLLKTQLIRKLYKQLGDPQREDFPDIYETAGWGWKKMSGYTQGIDIMTPMGMANQNSAHTQWHITRASSKKVRIVEEYTRAGWHCEVQAYNVLCNKYVKHPRYNNLWVRFYSSRDCNKYEYIIEGDE